MRESIKEACEEGMKVGISALDNYVGSHNPDTDGLRKAAREVAERYIKEETTIRASYKLIIALEKLCNELGNSAAPTPPAPEVEPVAEVVRFADGPWGEIYKTYVNVPSGAKLYTHPANDGLRKAAEELLGILDANWEDITEVQNLRAELNKGKS